MLMSRPALSFYDFRLRYQREWERHDPRGKDDAFYSTLIYAIFQ